MRATLRWKVAQAFELRWWQHYLHQKEREGYLSWKREYWRKILELIGNSIDDQADSALQKSQGLDVLDAGCGPAGIYMVFDQHQVDAVDPLISQYENKLAHFSPENYPWVNFFSSSLEQFSTQKKYDWVCCMNAINHVDDLQLCLEKLQTLLKEGGYLVITVDAHKMQWVKRLFNIIPGDILHPHQFDLNEYQDKLNRLSLETKPPQLVKPGFVFDHYLLVARKHSQKNSG